MFLDLRQIPSLSTPIFAMSTPGQPAQPTAAQPSAADPSSANDNSNSDAANQASSPADNSSPAVPATSDQASAQPSNNSPSATQNQPSPAQTTDEQPATEASNDASPTNTPPAEETSAADPSPSSDNASPSTSPNRSTQANPTTDAANPASTDDSNDDPSSTEEAATSEITTSEVLSTVVTVTGSSGPETSIILVTAIRTQKVTATEASTSATGTDGADAIGSGGSGSGSEGLSQKSKVAIGVAVPIAAIILFALLGLFWWKKRKTRRQAEEERRKEVEDYAYNPNADPTIPAVGMADSGYEMREDGSSGYRGWGNTTIGSTGRKASTTLSGGITGAYSDITSPTRGNMSDARSGEPLMDGSHSPEGEILGAMGPSTANNRGADVHRGPSNASSSYSAAGRSDASDPIGVPYGAGGAYYDQYSQNPYSDNGPQQAIIRDNPARRNTRIESPSHYPQQSAGISQNF
ncbi:serine-rich protein [Fusarium longipes]|uniref:Serine-rich protein n=1 Tax=Fusarium longipes TaxID=694270 RepID=A0A395RVF7_9HYPO|nr:serine-rich protein [Fusarium longipes]